VLPPPGMVLPKPNADIPKEALKREKPQASMVLISNDLQNLPDGILTLPGDYQLKIIANESLKLFSAFSDCEIKHTALVDWILREP